MMGTTQTNTNYNWANVSDKYLDEIIELEQKCVLRFIRSGKWAKYERARSNIQAAKAEKAKRKTEI